MKKMWIVVVVITTFMGFCGCEKTPVAKGGGGDLQGGEENSLIGTKWKLVGFFDAENNELTEAEPKECNECYVLEFQTDSNMIVDGYVNTMHKKYFIDYSTYTIQFYGYPIITLVDGNSYDEKKFFAAVNNTKSIDVINDDSLKLYHQSDGKRNYLLLQKKEA